ncbi:hypothetical protein [Streptomyces sp. NPDC101178]|uniref:hypothetical protein n=1 Tax=Streptomyces sp. NPDC101178 TaxID=3366124 RepID=UPI00380FD06F
MTFIDAALSAFTSLQPYLVGFLLDLPGNIAANLVCATGAALFAHFKSRSTTPPAVPQIVEGSTTRSEEPDAPHTNHINDAADHPPCPCTPPCT